MCKYSSLLILGPTGSGKSPLGDYLQAHGLWGRRVHHFDFGEALRQAAAAKGVSTFLSDKDRQFINEVLEKGLLLEDETFYIALNVLKEFCGLRGVNNDDILLLNGLPRHKGQAAGLEGVIKVTGILHLDCSKEVVISRIAQNSGGDRAHRMDDSLQEIENKLKIYHKRTLPLIEFYTSMGLPVIKIPVTVNVDLESLSVTLSTECFPLM